MEQLPLDIVAYIFDKLLEDSFCPFIVYRVKAVCKRWKAIISKQRWMVDAEIAKEKCILMTNEWGNMWRYKSRKGYKNYNGERNNSLIHYCDQVGRTGNINVIIWWKRYFLDKIDDDVQKELDPNQRWYTKMHVATSLANVTPRGLDAAFYSFMVGIAASGNLKILQLALQWPTPWGLSARVVSRMMYQLTIHGHHQNLRWFVETSRPFYLYLACNFVNDYIKNYRPHRKPAKYRRIRYENMCKTNEIITNQSSL